MSSIVPPFLQSSLQTSNPGVASAQSDALLRMLQGIFAGTDPNQLLANVGGPQSSGGQQLLPLLGASAVEFGFPNVPNFQPNFSQFGIPSGAVSQQPGGNFSIDMLLGGRQPFTLPGGVPAQVLAPSPAEAVIAGSQIAPQSSPSERLTRIDVPAATGTIVPSTQPNQDIRNAIGGLPPIPSGRREVVNVPAVTTPPPGPPPPPTGGNQPPAPPPPPGGSLPPGNLPPGAPPVGEVVPPLPPTGATQNPPATLNPDVTNQVLAPTVIADTDFDRSRAWLEDVLTHQTGAFIPDMDFGQEAIARAALGLGSGQIGLSDLLGPDVLRNMGQGSVLGNLLGGSAANIQNQPGGTQFNVSNPDLRRLLSGSGLDPNAVDAGSVAERQLFGLLGGEFSPRGFQELQGATEGALNNFGANQQQVTQGIGQLIGQGATGGQLGQNLTNRLFGQMNQQFDPTQAVNPEVNQFVNQTLNSGGLNPNLIAALDEQVFNPRREEVLGDLIGRGIGNSSARFSFEEDLIRDRDQTLARMAFDNAQNAAGLGLQGSALEQQARAQENARQGSLLGLGGGFQNQFSNQLANALGIGTSREGQAFSQGLGGFGATTDFSTGLLDQALGQQNIGRGLGLDAQQLGLQQQQTGLAQLGQNQQAALAALAAQQGLFGDVRDFGGTMQQFNQAQLSDNINAQLSRLLGLDQAAAARSAANKALVGTGIGAGAGIFSALKLAPLIAASSERFKSDIEDLDSKALLELRPVSYRYNWEDVRRPGLIAEEVEKVLPEMVIKDADGRPYAIDYSGFSALLLDQFQRLHKRLEELEARDV